ncbi:hypothetical protein M433DRAFT_436855 [Acidomyces richmondensis BFW]|nr:MAG: hypothetical protein FE78DRAFT_67217 [Acidomyces sp. 'richmondensis']KYG42018.1 hypothetical protein M433DRAFT_436855 [Acidomyces richmondensis BFW]
MPKRQQKHESDSGSIEDAPMNKKPKSNGKAPISTEMHKDEEGCEYWQISGKRRVLLSEFRGATYVTVREYYEANGEMRPGKKGISLSIDQYAAIIEIIPQIENVLKSKGILVPRPNYEGKAATPQPDEEPKRREGVKGDNEEKEEEKPQKSENKLDRFKMKANHEATSDEDEN